jgi:hypothetical protein
VHNGLGFSTFVVGLVAGSQFAASLISNVMFLGSAGTVLCAATVALWPMAHPGLADVHRQRDKEAIT